MTELATLEVQDNIAKITLNRPQFGNALIPELANDFLKAVNKVEADDSVRAVIITGAGKAFCAGGDLRYLLDVVSNLKPHEVRDFLMNLGAPILKLRSLKQPVIASINGAAVGAGFDLLLHCDIRIAAEDAVMGPTWVKNGIIPVMGSMSLLPRFIGISKATEMILCGSTISGKEAEGIGLVNKAVPKTNLDAESIAWAKKIIQNAPIATTIAKHGLNACCGLNLENELVRAVYEQSACMKTEDFKEGLKAIIEKRRPNFVGN
ncbi:MAG: enoyl-CoA hydratase/isomerase family protein [Syntrophales bacterium]|nr:enoyl-CoA hydratase/isomerase family protein [Syntrophales bacterium]